MLIQYLLIIAVGWFLVFFLRHHGTTRAAAGAKICFVAFVAFSVFAVLRPDDISVLARWLGVGRGTDLLVYGIAAGFAFASINTFLRFKELEVRYAQLARAIALRDGTSGPLESRDYGQHASDEA
jgi:hypothetical protein